MSFKPEITSSMKGRCIGQFSFPIEECCPKCALELDRNYDDVECLCDGDGTYYKNIVVPWDTCKDIYKKMAMVAHEDMNKEQTE